MVGKVQCKCSFEGGEVFEKYCGTRLERPVECLEYKSEGLEFKFISQEEPQKNFTSEQYDDSNEVCK